VIKRPANSYQEPAEKPVSPVSQSAEGQKIEKLKAEIVTLEARCLPLLTNGIRCLSNVRQN